MGEHEYDVEVVYRQRTIYRLTAVSREEAERKALESWRGGESGSLEGYDWSEIETVHLAETAAQETRRQDAELVLRFLQERERLIQRLGADSGGSILNDAISADQVASDLGWRRGSGADGHLVDVPRAAMALERLCEEHRVVCFERPRVREGERGSIRLYCTPEHLDHLTSEITPAERQVS